MTLRNDYPLQTAVGAGVLVIGLLLAAGALKIPAAAGYGGVGPNFLPWLVAVSLVVCGVMIVREALTGGFREMDAPSGAAQPYWPALAWISAGLLANAVLITTIGFMLSCTLCYMLAVQGLKRAQGLPAATPRALAMDLFTGVCISAPVYWTFTKFLAINLPGLTSTGWL
ncbi:MAG TPA: tripartite tricarboxylate transporter TctB family protein [Ramlibacter sp.]|nr:tripartite tricarboxylate transporter TctB family protein [Ramlibacter sp.]